MSRNFKSDCMCDLRCNLLFLGTYCEHNKQLSLESKVFVLHCNINYIPVKHLLTRIERQLQPVEAGVALWIGLQLVIGNLLDLELLELSSVAL